MNVRLLAVPYDSGARGVRMGAGPLRLLDLGLETRLEGDGHVTSVEVLDTPRGPVEAEVATAFALCRTLSDAVRRARGAGAFPLVLAGNCMSAVGAVAGMDTDAGVFWMDAHGDFNTPETTLGGFLDGMALAVLTGRCWQGLAGTVPGYRPVAEEDVALLGARDLDAAEARLLEATAVHRVEAGRVHAELPALAARVAERVDALYVHLDLDVLDPSEGTVNAFAAPGGLSLDGVGRVLARLADTGRVGAATLSAYEPDVDTDGRAGQAALTLARRLVSEVAGARGGG